MTSVRAWIAGAWAMCATTGCAAAPPPTQLAASAVAVAWSDGAARARLVAVAELDDVTVLFADDAATIVVDGFVTSVDRTVSHWTAAGVVPALDGGGRWVVGIDGDGTLRRLRARRGFEPISDRLGLAGARAHALCATDARVAVLLDDGVAVVEHGEVSRFAIAGTSLACGAHEIAVGGASGIRLLSATGADRSIALSPTQVAFTAGDRLLALADGRLYAMDSGATLRAVTPPDVSIATMAATVDGAWLAWPGTLAWFDGAAVARMSDARVGGAPHLFASSNGDAWLSEMSLISRFRRGAAADVGAWQATIAPVVGRTCVKCHTAGGVAGLELTTEAAWRTNKARIRERVIVRGDMPPRQPLTAAEHDAVRRFVER